MATATVTMESPSRVAAIVRPDVERTMEPQVQRITTRARQLAPVRTGKLRSSVRMDRRASSGRYAAAGTPISQYEISANTPYAGYVIFGTRPHVIRVKRARVLTDGKTFFGRQVRHPGTKANNFLQKALDEVGLNG